MPAALRAHTRYPEDMFRVQSELYRIYHMTQSAGLLQQRRCVGIGAYSSGNGEPRPVSPTYVFATLPGETKPSFC
jgi:uncharacterized membrane protein (UPF0182 family)